MKKLPAWRLWLEDNGRAVVIVSVIAVIAIGATLWELTRDPRAPSNGFPAAAATSRPFHCPEQIRIHRDGAVDYRGQTFLAGAGDRERLRALVAKDRKAHAGCRPNFIADPGTDVDIVVGVAQLLGVSKIGFLVEPRND